MRSFALIAAAFAVAPTFTAASGSASNTLSSTTGRARGAVTTRRWGQHKHRKHRGKGHGNGRSRDSTLQTIERNSTACASTVTSAGNPLETVEPAVLESTATSIKPADVQATAVAAAETTSTSTPSGVTTRAETSTRPAATTTGPTTASSVVSAAPGPVPSADSGSVESVSLSMHNEFRAKHGVSALTWNAELASTAQAWADKCVFEHSGGDSGENIAAWTENSSDVSQGVQMWYDEVSVYDFGNPGYASATGHFTQLVWKGTTELGCAVSKCSPLASAGFSSGSSYFYVCEYSAPGNIVGSNSAATAESFSANVLAPVS
ncbi:hypothetical protein JCM3770_004915 [Rhodotorula araucariae]